MSTILNQKGKNREELEALEVAEESRELEWNEPSLVAELFMGKLQAEAVLNYPTQDPEDKKIGDEYCMRLHNWMKENVDGDQIDREEQIPDRVMQGLAELGMFGLKIPKEYGGQGLSQINYARVLAVVARHCASIGATLSAHQSIGVPQPLKLFGTDEQKRKYLPKLAKGMVSAFALTEPGVGSDPAQMSVTATPTADGKHFIINGTKLWCTNGAIAELLVVMAKTPSIMDKGREKKQISAFIVETNTPGFTVVHRCKFLGLNGIQNALLKFDNVKVPAENLLWGLGKGLRLALVTLNAGRLSLPAACVGGTRELIRMSREWGNERKQWGYPIGKHEACASKLAQMSANLMAMESITWLSCAWVDRKSRDIRLEAAMAKVFCSITSHRMVEEALQMRGGRGYERASSLKARGRKPFPLERMLRDSRINQIVEGTSEILRLFIAREALDRHLKIGGDVLNPKLGIGKRLWAVVKAAGFYAFWYPRQWLAYTYWPRFMTVGKNAKHMRFVAANSHKLARTTFHLMLRHGPGLEKRQQQLMRLVEIATDLFAMAATVGFARSKAARGSEQFPNSEQIADVFCQEARIRVKQNFKSIWDNSDTAERKLANQILEGKQIWQEAVW